MTRTLLLRIIQLILLIILILLLANLWLGRASEVWWQRPVTMAIYPINADQHPLTQAYIDQLRPEHFADMESFFQREAARYRLPLTQPVEVKLAPRSMPHHHKCRKTPASSTQFCGRFECGSGCGVRIPLQRAWIRAFSSITICPAVRSRRRSTRSGCSEE